MPDFFYPNELTREPQYWVMFDIISLMSAIAEFLFGDLPRAMHSSGWLAISVPGMRATESSEIEAPGSGQRPR